MSIFHVIGKYVLKPLMINEIEHSKKHTLV